MRVKRTHKALLDALLTLLEQKRFSKITVNDLCEEAYISRPTFYAHFEDKYDLVRYWLDRLSKDFQEKKTALPVMAFEETVNALLHGRSGVIANLLAGYDPKIQSMLHFLITENLPEFDRQDPWQLFLSDMCAGGLISSLLTQANSDTCRQITFSAAYFQKLIRRMTDWHEPRNTEDEE